MSRIPHSERQRSRFNSTAHHILGTPTSNKRGCQDLKLQVEQLIYELQQKDVTIAALQRSYECLSVQTYGELTWKDKAAMLERENAQLHTQVSSASISDQTKRLMSETQTLKTSLDSKQKHLKQSETSVFRLKSELESLKKTCKGLETALEQTRSNTDSKWATDECQHLKKQLLFEQTHSEEKDRIILNLQNSVKILEDRVKAHESQNKRQRAQLAELHQQSRQELGDLQSKIVELEHQNSDLSQENGSLRTQISKNRLKREELRQTLENEQEQKLKFKRYLAELEQEIKSLSERQGFQEQAKTLLAEKADLQRSLESLNQEFSVLKEEKYLTETKLDKEKSQSVVLYDKLAAEMLEKREILSRNAVLQSQLSEIDRLRQELESQNHPGLQQKIEKLAGKLRKAKEWSAKYEHESSVLSEENSIYKEKVLSQSKEIIELRHLQYKINSLNAQASRFREKEADLQALVARQAAEINFLKNNSKPENLPRIGLDGQLVHRIEYMKGELERYRPSEIESQRELRQRRLKDENIERAVERLEMSMKAVESCLICPCCQQALEGWSVGLPCKHIVCKSCQKAGQCAKCDRRVSSSLGLEVLDGLAGRVEGCRRTMEEMKRMLG